MKGKFTEMEELAEKRAKAAERLRADMESQRKANEAVLQAKEEAVASAQHEKERMQKQLESRNRLNEALHVEVVYADDLRAKEASRRKEVCCCCTQRKSPSPFCSCCSSVHMTSYSN